jgi:ribosomal protein L37AE/L43A
MLARRVTLILLLFLSIGSAVSLCAAGENIDISGKSYDSQKTVDSLWDAYNIIVTEDEKVEFTIEAIGAKKVIVCFVIGHDPTLSSDYLPLYSSETATDKCSKTFSNSGSYNTDQFSILITSEDTDPASYSIKIDISEDTAVQTCCIVVGIIAAVLVIALIIVVAIIFKTVSGKRKQKVQHSTLPEAETCRACGGVVAADRDKGYKYCTKCGTLVSGGAQPATQPAYQPASSSQTGYQQPGYGSQPTYQPAGTAQPGYQQPSYASQGYPPPPQGGSQMGQPAQGYPPQR